MKGNSFLFAFSLLFLAMLFTACATPEAPPPEPLPTEQVATIATPDFQQNLVACTPENQAAWLAVIDPVLEELARNAIDLGYNTSVGNDINFGIERSLSEGFLMVLELLAVPDCLIQSQQAAYAAINAHIAALDSWQNYNPALAPENLEGQEYMSQIFDSLRATIRSASNENIELGVESVLSLE